MTLPWETVHIFISSTFNDMHAERDYLVKRVFPELREWCEKRKLRLVDIDLRWGVTEQDATSQNVVKVCLDRIDDCRPFFLCFLGQRRGWVPKEEEISAATKAEFPALKEYTGKASVTEMEILHALVNPLHRGQVRDPKKPGEFYEPNKYAFFYLREDSYLDQLPHDPPQLRQTYTNEGVEKEKERLDQDQQLKRWREVEIPATKRPVRNYHAQWDVHLSTPELLVPLQCPSQEEKSIELWQEAWQKAGVTVTGMDVEADPSQAEKAYAFNKLLSTGRLSNFQADRQPLSQVIVADLQEAIAARYPEHTELVGETDLQKELDQQEQFLYSGSQGFIEREGDFDELDAYVNNDSNQLFVLTAPGGMGKSSLLATWVARYRTAIEGKDGYSIHFRFIGQSDRSTTVYSLLNLLLHELKEIAGKIPEEIPNDPQKLRQKLLKLLESAGKRGNSVIILDALNQLESGYSDLTWLPSRLPKNIKLIVSFKRGEPAAENLLKTLHGKAVLGEVKPFENLDHRKQLVDKYLEQYLKQMDTSLVDSLIRSSGASNPLFLKVVLSELRVFGAFANLSEKIRSDFGETPVSAFDAMLNRLETDPAYSSINPKEAVPLLFGLLAHSRQGLSVDELSDIFVQVFAVNKLTARDTIHLYLRQVRSFLAQREERYDFFFESYEKATLDRYVNKEGKPPQKPTQDWHRLLADYFFNLPVWKRDTESQISIRKLAELPFHQTYGQLWSDLIETLTDFTFLEAKCRFLSVYELETDYRRAIQNWQGDYTLKNVLIAFEERFRIDSYNILRDQELFFPYLYNHLTWLDEQLNGPIHSICEGARQYYHNWLRMIQDPCQDPRSESSPTLLLEGHRGSVSTVVITPDSKCIVSGSSDTCIKVWDLESGQLLQSFQGSTGVNSIVITHDSQVIVISSSDSNTIQILNLDNGQLLRSLRGHAGGINAVAVTPDGNQIISGSNDKTIKVWDLESGRLQHSLEKHKDKICTVTVAPNGNWIVSGSDDKTIKVWDTESGQMVHSLQGHTESVSAVAITHDSHLIVSGSDDKTIKIWNLETGCLIHTLEGHTGQINSLAITPDGQRIISGSKDKTIKVWDLESGQLTNSLDGHTRSVTSVAVSTDGQWIVSGSADWSIKVWDQSDCHLLHSLTGFNTPQALAITPDGHMIIYGCMDKTIKVRDLESGKLLFVLEGHTDEVHSLAVVPDSKQFVSGSWDCTIRVWDLENRQLLYLLKGHQGPVNVVAITPDGKQIISGSDDKTLKVWDLESGKLLRTLEGHSKSVRSLAIFPDGRLVVSSGAYDSINVWNLESGEILHSFGGEKFGYDVVALTPDGKRIIATTGMGYIKVWLFESNFVDISKMGFSFTQSIVVTPDNRQIITACPNEIKVLELRSEQVRSIKEHFLTGSLGFGLGSSEVSCVVLIPGRRQIVSGSVKNTLNVWDLDSGRLLRSLKGSNEFVSEVSLIPTKEEVVSGSENKSAKGTQLESRLVCALEGHAEQVNAITISPNGQNVISGSEDIIRVWDLKSGYLLQSLQHGKDIYALWVTPDGKRIVSGSSDKTIKVWDLESGQLINSYRGFREGATLTPDGQHIISEDDLGYWVYELKSLHKLLFLKGSDTGFLSPEIAVTPDGRHAVFVQDETFKVWDITINKQNPYAFLPNAEALADAFGIPPVTSEKPLIFKKGNTEKINAVAITSDSQKVVSYSINQTLKIWDLTTGILLQSFKGDSGKSHGRVVIAPDDQHAITSSSRNLKHWDLNNGQARILFRNSTAIQCLALTSDGCWLACGDRSGRVWIFEWIQ